MAVSDTSKETRSLRVLFLLKHAGYARNFESTIRLLAQRGHSVHLGFQRDSREKLGMAGHQALVDGIISDHPSVTLGMAPERSADGLGRVVAGARRAENYLLYFDDRYAAAPKLRARAKDHAPKLVARLLKRRAMRTHVGLATMHGTARAVIQAAPTSARIDRFLATQRPDIVLVSPLVELNPTQGDYIRSARSLGVPSLFSIFSWDNLTNKGRISDPPDAVAVWNEEQKREIVEIHGVSANRVAITGAPPYDRWFDAQPSVDRGTFGARVGLPADRPIVLYACSSSFIAAEEVGFVRRWLSAVRATDDSLLARAGVLVRPHPQNADQWRLADLSDLGPVSVWPRAGREPVDSAGRADYFDSLYHCAAVVGINTSALIESAILRKPVLTVLDPDFQATQGGTLHFSHLLEVNGGLLHVADTLGRHTRQLSAALEDPTSASDRSRRFVEAYIRPGNLMAAATPRLVEAIEGAAVCQPTTPPRCLSASMLMRMLLTAVARRAGASP